MSFPVRRRILIVAGIFLAASSALCCGGGGGGGGGRDVVDPSCLSFTAGGTPNPSTVIATESAASTCEVAQLDVRITGVDDVYAGSFTVSYDAAMVSYEGTSLSGSILNEDGAAVEVIENEGAGSVTIGLTRIGVDTGVDFDTTGTLITLIFRILPSAGSGSGGLTFSNGELVGSETPPEEKSGLQWHGGNLRID